jgi:hypothetical protein
MRRYTNTVLDRKGNPVPGVDISVYPAGSTASLSTIYENTDGTNQINQTNFTTDSRGEFTFCAGDGTYDIHFSGPGVESLVWYDVQLQDANPSWFDVTEPQFGAVGDGSTDDHAAIQSAINACASAGGGVVYLPAGDYVSTMFLRVDSHGVSIRGDGPGSGWYTGSHLAQHGTRIRFTISNPLHALGLTFGDPATVSLNHCGLRDICLTSTDGSVDTLLEVDSCRNFLGENVSLYHNKCKTDGAVALSVDASAASASVFNTFRSFEIVAARYNATGNGYGHGVWLQNTGTSYNNDNVFESCNIWTSSEVNGGHLIHTDGANFNTFSSCLLQASDWDDAVLVDSGSNKFVGLAMDSDAGTDLLFTLGSRGTYTTVIGSIDGVITVDSTAAGYPQNIQVVSTKSRAIASGVLYAPGQYHTVDGESGADDLDTLTPAWVGREVTLAYKTDAITLKDGTGNLDLGGDQVMNVAGEFIKLVFNGTDWVILVDNVA